jgi:hypothetical protein
MNGNQGSSEREITAEQIIAVCRAEIESLHNLQYLWHVCIAKVPIPSEAITEDGRFLSVVPSAINRYPVRLIG